MSARVHACICVDVCQHGLSNWPILTTLWPAWADMHRLCCCSPRPNVALFWSTDPNEQSEHRLDSTSMKQTHMTCSRVCRDNFEDATISRYAPAYPKLTIPTDAQLNTQIKSTQCITLYAKNSSYKKKQYPPYFAWWRLLHSSAKNLRDQRAPVELHGAEQCSRSAHKGSYQTNILTITTPGVCLMDRRETPLVPIHTKIHWQRISFVHAS